MDLVSAGMFCFEQIIKTYNAKNFAYRQIQIFGNFSLRSQRNISQFNFSPFTH